MTSKRTAMIVTLLLFIAGMTAQAAPGGGEGGSVPEPAEDCSKYGPDKDLADQEYSLYREFYKQDNYKDALPHWRYLFENAPGRSKNIYFNGAKMYKECAEQAKGDSTVQQAFVDTLIEVYMQRIECFDERGKVLGYLAYDLYRFRPREYATVYTYFHEAVTLEGDETGYYLLFPYFQYTTLLWRIDDADVRITDDDVLDTYDTLMAIVEANLVKAEMEMESADEKTRNDASKDFESWTDTRGKIEELVPRSLLTCSKLVERLTRDRDRIRASVTELKRAYNAIKLAPPDTVDGKKVYCTSEPVFGEIVLKLFEEEPSATLAREAGYIKVEQGDMTAALDFFNKELELSEDKEKKAAAALNIAKILKNERQFVKSREYARQALQHKPGWGEPYILIGDLYASSGSICEGMDGELAALAALDKYAMAKRDAGSAEEAQARINKYSEYIPTITYLFERGLNEGVSYTYQCWIGETTTLRGQKSN